jgi:hypothetical protein
METLFDVIASDFAFSRERSVAGGISEVVEIKEITYIASSY